MRKIYKIIFLIFFFSPDAFSQQITFQKTFGGILGDVGYSVHQTTDGGYIIAGYTQSFGAGNWDVYLIKTDINGNSLWAKTFGGTNDDVGNSVQQTMDGGYIIIGQTLSFGAGSYDVYLIKTDSNGNSLWNKTFGGTNEDDGHSVQQTTDGGYIIIGYSQSFGAGSGDIYLIKTDANGDTLWTKTFGGTNDDDGYSVQQTTDGGYIIAGYTRSFGVGNNDVYLIKTDSSGISLWSRTFGGFNDDFSFSVQQTKDNGFIITGDSRSFVVLNSDGYLIKTDINGNILWTKTFGGTTSEYAKSIQETNDSAFIITGFTWSFGAGNTDVFLIKIDANGDTLWTKTFGGTNLDEGYSVQQTTDGGYIITGLINSFGAGGSDIYLIKIDSLGNNGCNEGSAALIVTTPPTQVTSPLTIVGSPVTIVTTPTTIVGSGGIENTLCVSVGIIQHQNQISNFQFSPNPLTSSSTLTFSNPQNNKFTFSLYDITGRLCVASPLERGQGCVITTDNKIILEKGTKPAGVYLFKLVNEKTGEGMNGKIVIN